MTWLGEGARPKHHHQLTRALYNVWMQGGGEGSSPELCWQPEGQHRQSHTPRAGWDTAGFGELVAGAALGSWWQVQLWGALWAGGAGGRCCGRAESTGCSVHPHIPMEHSGHSGGCLHPKPHPWQPLPAPGDTAMSNTNCPAALGCRRQQLEAPNITGQLFPSS